MPTFVARRALAAAMLVAALPVAAGQAYAASRATEAYLADVRLHVDILAASDKIAMTAATRPALKRFAQDGAARQAGVLSALDGWRAGEDGATPAQIAALPMQTGRSVATDPQAIDALSPPPGIGVLMAGASATLDHLSGLDGAAFDADFATTQRAALRALEGLYEAYSHTGDTPALRAMATRELVAVRAAMVALDRA